MWLYWVLRRGTYLARRWEEDGAVNLYYCAGRGFFVEVGMDDGRGQAVVLCSLMNSAPLEDYAQVVRLPGV